jgi:hypothetical protein
MKGKSMELADAKDWATIIGAVIALGALAKGVFEYSLQGAQKRAEQFVGMRRRFKENETFRELCSLTETDDPRLSTTPFKDKRDLLGFFEEIALMTNSGLIRESVAHYMFGYYAIRCWKSTHFWHGVNRESSYWSLFRDFVSRMENREAGFTFRRREMRF